MAKIRTLGSTKHGKENISHSFIAIFFQLTHLLIFLKVSVLVKYDDEPKPWAANG